MTRCASSTSRASRTELAAQRSPARSASATGTVRCTPPTASNYRQVPIGVVRAAHRRRRGGDGRRRADATVRPCSRAAAAPAWPASAATSRWSSTGRSTCTRARRRRPGGEDGAGRTGLRPRRPARRSRDARADVRARSGDPQPLHARRDDRQQLVRRPLRDGGPHGRQRRVARRRSPTTGCGSRSARPPTTSSSASSPPADGAARSTRACAACATATPTRSGGAIPDIPRRVSGYNLDELLPEHGFDVARALVGTEGTCVTVLGAELAADRRPAGEERSSCSATPTCTPPVATSREVMDAGPTGCEGIDRRLFHLTEQLGLHPGRRGAHARRPRLADRRVRRRHQGREPTPRRSDLMARLRARAARRRR